MKKSQSGFTLIEMVAVIIILAIMAAVAFPRFTNLSGQARLSALNGVAGSLRSAVVLAKSTWLANNSGVVSTVNLNGTDINVFNAAMTASEVMWGVPVHYTSDIIYALDGNTTGFSSSYTVTSGTIFWPTGAATSANCLAWYQSGTVTLAASAAAGTAAGCL